MLQTRGAPLSEVNVHPTPLVVGNYNDLLRLALRIRGYFGRFFPLRRYRFRTLCEQFAASESPSTIRFVCMSIGAVTIPGGWLNGWSLL